MKRDMERVIAALRHVWPDLVCEQLEVSHPGADDDGLWFLRHPDLPGEVQFESSTGSFPFLVESDGTAARDTVHTVDEAVAVVGARLRLAAVRH